MYNTQKGPLTALKARRHIPNCVDLSTPPEEYEAENTEKLLSADWIKRYEEWDEFHNFCKSKDGKKLMIENEDGTWWWVVAHITGDLDLKTVRMKEIHDD